MVRNYLRRRPEYKDKHPEHLPDGKPRARKTVTLNKDGTQTVDSVIKTSPEKINDKDFLLKEHGFSPDEWEIISARNSIYDMQLKGGAVETLYASKVTVKPISGITEKDTLKHFIEKAERYSPVKPRTVQHSSDNILVINIVDLHIGQLSWGQESGENYDYKIARTRYQGLITDIIAKSLYKEYEKITFVIGNDFFNSDNMDGLTTKGTKQTNDIRPQKMFDKGADLLVWGLDALRSAFQTTPIETLLIPGNHDTLTAYYAAKYLYAWFRNDDTVTIDISPKKHKGFAYGATALLFTHGENELKNLAWVYTEFRPLIGKTKVTEIHAGHLHKVKVEEKNGAIVYTNPSPTALDNWTYGQGYGAVAQTISRVYNKEKGLEFEIHSKVM